MPVSVVLGEFDIIQNHEKKNSSDKIDKYLFYNILQEINGAIFQP